MEAIFQNARALGEALYDRGLDVVAPEKDFTSSHVMLADVIEHGLGGDFEKELENANIMLNRNLLPWDIREDRHYENPGGIRIGVSEVTRLGMGEEEMEQIADFIAQIIVEGMDPGDIKNDVEEFSQSYSEVHYCFDFSVEAYEYLDILSS